MKIKLITYSILTTLLLSACSEWFEIEQKTEISEKALFDTEIGFYNALYGVYLEASQPNLYGQSLAYEFIDISANLYTVSTSNLTYNLLQDHTFNTEKSIISTSDNIWSNQYNCIANCNNILKNLKGKENMFPEGNFELLQGELIALRAFFHFDLLRMFAPAPAAGVEKYAIPYVDSISVTPFEQLTVQQVLDKVITDLETAQALLKENDPIFRPGYDYANDNILSNINYWSTITDNGITQYRKSRMNYYAVTGVLARVYLYAGNMQKAYSNAKIVYNARPLTSSDVLLRNNSFVGAIARNSDKTSKESEPYFKANASSKILDMTSENLDVLYPEGMNNDLRYKYNFSPREGETKIFLNKYFYASSFVVQFFSKAESYLILAETANANGDDPYIYLDSLRAVRGLSLFPIPKDQSAVESQIYHEFCKEFIGEGQIFFYLKRKNVTSYTGVNGRNISGLTYKSFIFPIPLDEIEFGNIKATYNN